MLAIAYDPALRDDPGLVSAAVAAVRLSVENERLQAEVRAPARGGPAHPSPAGRGAGHGTAATGTGPPRWGTAASRVTPDLTGVASAATRAGGRPSRAGGTRRRQCLKHRPRSETCANWPAGTPPGGPGRGRVSVARSESLAERSTVDVDVTRSSTDRLPPAVEATAYFVVAEALTNTAKHAVGAAPRPPWPGRPTTRLRLEIVDDGRGRGGHRRRARACAGSRTGSPPWVARCGSPAGRAPGRPSPWSCRANCHSRGRRTRSGPP